MDFIWRKTSTGGYVMTFATIEKRVEYGDHFNSSRSGVISGMFKLDPTADLNQCHATLVYYVKMRTPVPRRLLLRRFPVVMGQLTVARDLLNRDDEVDAAMIEEMAEHMRNPEAAGFGLLDESELASINMLAERTKMGLGLDFHENQESWESVEIGSDPLCEFWWGGVGKGKGEKGDQGSACGRGVTVVDAEIERVAASKCVRASAKRAPRERRQRRADDRRQQPRERNGREERSGQEERKERASAPTTDANNRSSERAGRAERQQPLERTGGKSGQARQQPTRAPITDAVHDARANSRRELGPASLQLLLSGRSGWNLGCRGETPRNPLLPSRSHICSLANAPPNPPAAGEVAHVLARTRARLGDRLG
jgi:hypothetical protein